MLKDAIFSHAIAANLARRTRQYAIRLFFRLGVKEWTTVALPTFAKRKGDANGTSFIISTIGFRIAMEEST